MNSMPRMSEPHSNGLACSLLGLMLPAIWLLDLTWWRMSPDVCIIVCLVPLAWWLAVKNPTNNEVRPVKRLCVALAAVSLALGVVLNQMFLMAFGWAGLAVLFCLPASAIPKLRLWVLCAGAFPWVLLDLNTLSWWFRLQRCGLDRCFLCLAGQRCGGEWHFTRNRWPANFSRSGLRRPATFASAVEWWGGVHALSLSAAVFVLGDASTLACARLGGQHCSH